jgi:hypothetical protein
MRNRSFCKKREREKAELRREEEDKVRERASSLPLCPIYSGEQVGIVGGDVQLHAPAISITPVRFG